MSSASFGNFSSTCETNLLEKNFFYEIVRKRKQNIRENNPGTGMSVAYSL